MNSRPIARTVIISVVLVLLFSILTVETNRDAGASFKERCPTCIDSNAVFIPLEGIDPSFFVNSTKEHIFLSDDGQVDQYKDLTNHYDRAPPVI